VFFARGKIAAETSTNNTPRIGGLLSNYFKYRGDNVSTGEALELVDTWDIQNIKWFKWLRLQRIVDGVAPHLSADLKDYADMEDMSAHQNALLYQYSALTF
jgi:hypothetical protein